MNEGKPPQQQSPESDVMGTKELHRGKFCDYRDWHCSELAKDLGNTLDLGTLPKAGKEMLTVSVERVECFRSRTQICQQILLSCPRIQYAVYPPGAWLTMGVIYAANERG